MNTALKGNAKSGSAVKDLGCSIEEFKSYLENLWVDGMSWDNYGRRKGEWCIDHIVPLASVDLTIREEFLKVAHYTNMQPLWVSENNSKQDRLDWVRKTPEPIR